MCAAHGHSLIISDWIMVVTKLDTIRTYGLILGSALELRRFELTVTALRSVLGFLHVALHTRDK